MLKYSLRQRRTEEITFQCGTKNIHHRRGKLLLQSLLQLLSILEKNIQKICRGFVNWMKNIKEVKNQNTTEGLSAHEGIRSENLVTLKRYI